MTVLVTRPQPDADTTATALRARGFEPLIAPMLQFEARPLKPDGDIRFAAIIVTSANALRALKDDAALVPLLALPLYAVGEKTAETARETGFGKVISADGDAGSLRDLIAKRGKPGDPLLYLAGADLARDLAGELGARGFTVVTQTTYRMVPVRELPQAAAEAIGAGAVEAVLHYSRRSARAFAEAARSSGVEVTALSLPQCCLSEAVATVIRDCGANRVVTAAKPDEIALFETLERAIRPRSR
jgi:uroporphyrinogen-III synthase